MYGEIARDVWGKLSADLARTSVTSLTADSLKHDNIHAIALRIWIVLTYQCSG